MLAPRYTLEEYAQDNDNLLNRIYIAGPISMLPYAYAKERFDNAQKRLNLAGFYNVANPTSICDKEWENERCMRVCISRLAEYDAIYLQRFWWLSRGARLDRKIAIACGLDIIYE